MNSKQEMLRSIPKMDQVLQDQRLFVFFGALPRPLIADGVRETLELLREAILKGEEVSTDMDAVAEAAVRRIERLGRRSLRRVINATGVVLHTNLGRAPLSSRICENVEEVAGHYSTLEYDLGEGSRGSRHSHVEKLLTRITGTEAAMVVNNNAAAVLLCLSALAAGGEVIVSRGELVEIGGSFRVPEIMALGGARLKEVGTTNKTKLSDYRGAVTESTAVLLKVHTSNYRIVGFTAEATLEELAELGREKALPLVYDMGSGLLADLQKYGVDEPVVTAAVKSGADLVLFSGDKLLGGPQAGIAVGKREYVEKMKKHPLARAVRIDKMTLAALEETFRLYLEPERALEEIPVLSMITASPDQLRNRARRLEALVRRKAPEYCPEVVESPGQVGGGAAPGTDLAGYAVALNGQVISPPELERRLREGQPPVVVRIVRDRVLLEVRTLMEEELELVAEALARAGKEGPNGV
ncbi:MAG: L-seryl-tRNA(Sec) selenium transferase [Bacillota bacterium]|nr:L-seryl-tRNA(Sec) selenium transferase [Bacillota bacterium]